MRLNESMKQLLRFYGIYTPEDIPPAFDLPIRKKTDPQQRPYWGVRNFYGMDRYIAPDQNLSWLEWDANDTHISTEAEQETAGILTKALAIMNGWKKQMETDFPEIPFIILMSFDDGSEMTDEKDYYAGVTFRFWARRDVLDPVDAFDLEHVRQPVLAICCNFDPRA